MQKFYHYNPDRETTPEGKPGGVADSANLQRLCVAALRCSFRSFRDADIEAEFYPYIGLTHTLRRKRTKWILRISDHCLGAPAPVIEAVVRILACRAMRRKPPPEVMKTYEQFRKDPEVEKAVRSRRAAKGRKQFSGKPGEYHSLRKIFSELNERYFNNQIEINRIGWGLRRGRGRLGHYDPIHNTITLSPLLDAPDIPPFVVRYIVYHEMLHALFGNVPAGSGRNHHPGEFRQAECSYPDYGRARTFLADFGRTERRASR